ncbi:hypothetical protein LCGC14_0372350 [marine sediment metagenome]|uniref:Uncharacterized protein n=1 Tax=marine sediment metagenome TaxID=412755 RepID=A0A0F9TAJ4_9ZZZZ
MKCSEGSKGIVNVIHLTCDDILTDKSVNTLEQSISLIESQVEMLRILEGLDKK